MRRASYGLIARGGFLAVLRDGSLRARLEGAARSLRDWSRALEAQLELGTFKNQRQAELANTLMVGGRDLEWQIDRDILSNLEPLRRLLGGEDFPDAVLGHGWQLNLVLNSLDRLEVRGRDSAALAVYLRFPDRAGLERFLDGPGSPRRTELEARSKLPAFSHLALVQPDSNERTFLFAYKVAEEVGEMGQNVRFLRDAIARDGFFQAALREPRVEVQALAHTRWASNGVVSLPNCHPVDSTISVSGRPLTGSRGGVVAVLNGDVDNYQELFQRYIRDQGMEIDEEITTDAKIIPLVVGHHYRRTGSLEEAFRTAFDEFEGSMAIGIMAADRPGEFLFGQKGSGQGLFIGFAGPTVAVASEMYGLVELTPDYLKAEGERTAGGEVFRLKAGPAGVEVNFVSVAPRLYRDGEERVGSEDEGTL